MIKFVMQYLVVIYGIYGKPKGTRPTLTLLTPTASCSAPYCPAESRALGARGTPCTCRHAPPTPPARASRPRRSPPRLPPTGCRCCRKTIRSAGTPPPTTRASVAKRAMNSDPFPLFVIDCISYPQCRHVVGRVEVGADGQGGEQGPLRPE